MVGLAVSDEFLGFITTELLKNIISAEVFG
jgi:hypothetical protein